MERDSDPEEAPAAAGNTGFVAAGIDALSSALQRLRPFPTVRPVFIFFLALLIGTVAGMLFSYSLLSQLIADQSGRIDAQRKTNAELAKETPRLKVSEARCRDDLAVAEKTLAETQHRLILAGLAAKRGSNPSARSATKGTAFPEYRGNASDISGAAGKSSVCDVESGNPEKGMANCLDALKRK